MDLDLPARREVKHIAPRPPSVSPAKYSIVCLLAVPAVLAVSAWAMQHGPLDLVIAGKFFDVGSETFPWRSSAWLDVVGHQTARALPIVIGVLALAAGAASGALPALRPWRRVLFALGAAMILGPLLIAALKTTTSQHCPAQVSPFGGIVDYAMERDGPFFAHSRETAGHCLPSGHAGGGFALLSLYFAGWAAGRPNWRWTGLAVGIAGGLLFSVVRMMQGAHFASATLWSATLDWTVAALVFMPLLCSSSRRPV